MNPQQRNLLTRLKGADSHTFSSLCLDLEAVLVDAFQTESIDALEVMQRSQTIPPLIAVGHSMGATSALLTATRHPHLFSALIMHEPVLVDPTLASFPLRCAFHKISPNALVQSSNHTILSCPVLPRRLCFRRLCHR